MEPTLHPRVKVCCIASREEAWMAIREGASALGLVSAMPSGPGVIDDATIAERGGGGSPVGRHLPPHEPPGHVAHRPSAASPAHHHGSDLRPGGARLLRGAASSPAGHRTRPGRARDGTRVGRGGGGRGPGGRRPSPRLGQPVPGREGAGGTGRRHDWRTSRLIREAVPVPVFLAGGLGPHNVDEAIAEVGAFGLDICSGVRTGGRLDPRKLAAFFAPIRTIRA